MPITVTPEAQSKALDILKDAGPDMVFRIAIKGGGCSGFQYEFLLDEKKDDDIIVDEGIVTDMISIQYLDGSVLEFEMQTFSQLFVLKNPNEKTRCGCGSSFGV